MKHLTLIRHAKSSWKNPLLNDFDRPLNKRGKHDAPLMGHSIKNTLSTPDLILSSPARRTCKTIAMIAKIIDYPEKNILYKEDMYHAGTDELAAIIRKIDNLYSYVFICGHNPGITGLANYLCDDIIDNIPTCGLVQIRFGLEKWE